MHAYVRLLCVYMYCLCVNELVCVCVCVCMSVLRLFIRWKYAVARLIRTFDGKIFQLLFFSFARSCIFFSSTWLSHIFLGSCSDFHSLANYNKTIASDLQPISYKQRIRSQFHIKSSVIYWPLLDSIPFDLIEFRIATEFNANEICHGQLILDTNYCNTFPLQLMIEWIEKKTSQMCMILFMHQIEQFSNFFKIFFDLHGNIEKFSRISIDFIIQINLSGVNSFGKGQAIYIILCTCILHNCKKKIRLKLHWTLKNLFKKFEIDSYCFSKYSQSSGVQRWIGEARRNCRKIWRA